MKTTTRILALLIATLVALGTLTMTAASAEAAVPIKTKVIKTKSGKLKLKVTEKRKDIRVLSKRIVRTNKAKTKARVKVKYTKTRKTSRLVTVTSRGGRMVGADTTLRVDPRASVTCQIGQRELVRQRTTFTANCVRDDGKVGTASVAAFPVGSESGDENWYCIERCNSIEGFERAEAGTISGTTAFTFVVVEPTVTQIRVPVEITTQITLDRTVSIQE